MKKQNNLVSETLFSASYPHLHKHTSVYQILLTSIIALGGIIAVIFALQSDESDSTLCMSMLTLGVLLLLFSNQRICNQLLLNILQVISQKYGHNL